MTIPNQAIEEIKEILKKHDLAGVAFVQDGAECAYLYHFDPSWSCARLRNVPGGTEIRIRSKLAEYESREAQAKQVSQTTGMILSFMNRGRDLCEQMRKIGEMLGKQFGISHFERHN